MESSSDYTTIGCPVPFLTLVDPANQSVLLSEPCSVTYAEYVGSNYTIVTAFFSVLVAVSLIVTIVQLVRLIRAYGWQTGLKSVQVWMHIRISIMYFFMFIKSWDFLDYTSWYPYKLGMFTRLCASITSYLICFAIMFVWHRTGTELNRGRSQTVDMQERVVTGLMILMLAVLIILNLAWNDLPAWKFDAGYFGLMAVSMTGIYSLNFYFGYYIYSNLSKSSKLSGRTKEQNWRTFFSGNNDVWKVIRVVLAGFILAIVVISMQIASCLRALKDKYGIRVEDIHRPVLVTIPQLVGDYVLFMMPLILGWVLLYSFKNIRAKPPSTSRQRSNDLKSPRSRKGTVDDRFSALDNSKKVPSLDDIALGPEVKHIPSFGGSSIDLRLPATATVAPVSAASTAPSSDASAIDARGDIETPAPPSGDSSV